MERNSRLNISKRRGRVNNIRDEIDFINVIWD